MATEEFPEVEAETETVVVEDATVEEFPVVPMPLDTSLDPDFDYYEFNKTGRIDFSPEYFEEIMKLYKGREKIRNTGRGTKKTKAPEFFYSYASFCNSSSF